MVQIDSTYHVHDLNSWRVDEDERKKKTGSESKRSETGNNMALTLLCWALFPSSANSLSIGETLLCMEYFVVCIPLLVTDWYWLKIEPNLDMMSIG